MENVAQKFAAETGWELETKNNRISARCPAFLNAYFDIYFQTSNQQDKETSSFCFEIDNCPQTEDRDFRVYYNDAVRLAKLINEIYDFAPKPNNDFQPLVIGNKVNFPELNRRIEVQLENGMAFNATAILDTYCGSPQLAIIGSGNYFKLNNNLKWRYADQDQ